MIYDIIFTILAVVLSGLIFGILSDLYLKRDAKKRAKGRNDRGSVALIVLIPLMFFALAQFIIQDAARDQPVKTTQIFQPTARETDPNEPAK